MLPTVHFPALEHKPMRDAGRFWQGGFVDFSRAGRHGALGLCFREDMNERRMAPVQPSESSVLRILSTLLGEEE